MNPETIAEGREGEREGREEGERGESSGEEGGEGEGEEEEEEEGEGEGEEEEEGEGEGEGEGVMNDEMRDTMPGIILPPPVTRTFCKSSTRKSLGISSDNDWIPWRSPDEEMPRKLGLNRGSQACGR